MMPFVNHVALQSVVQLICEKAGMDSQPRKFRVKKEEDKSPALETAMYLHFISFEKVSTFRIVSRPFSDSPASGSFKRFEKRHKEVIDYVFDYEKDNQILK